MMPQPTKTRKSSQQPVTVEVIDCYAGTYLTYSRSGQAVYMTDVKARTCGCPAVQTRCKAGCCAHIIAARVVARALASMTATDRVQVVQTIRRVRVNVAAVDISRLSAPLAQRAA